MVPLPSLAEMQSMLKRMVVFVAENRSAYSFYDECFVERLCNKTSRMAAANLARKRQSTITSYFAAP